MNSHLNGPLYVTVVIFTQLEKNPSRHVMGSVRVKKTPVPDWFRKPVRCFLLGNWFPTGLQNQSTDWFRKPVVPVNPLVSHLLLLLLMVNLEYLASVSWLRRYRIFQSFGMCESFC
nr:hypothetical protein Iba_scaffold17528.3CG0240 [Ipomoea batatas]